MLPSIRYHEITRRKYVYNIMPIANIPTVMQYGIVCYNRANRLAHTSIAITGVQELRDKVTIPNGRNLHDYASLYFSFWNPMLSVRRNQNEQLCILAVKSTVLDIEGCIVSDRNAAVELARFYPPHIGLEKIDFSKVHAEFWIGHTNPYENSEHKTIKCAEVLIPDYVPLEYIAGAYVVSEEAKQDLLNAGFDRQILVKSNYFFGRG